MKSSDPTCGPPNCRPIRDPDGQPSGFARGVAGLRLHLDVDETDTRLAIVGNEDPQVARVTVTVAQ